MAPSSTAATTSVQVALRIRPSTAQDATSIPARFQRAIIHAISPTTVSVDGSSSAPSGAGVAASATAVAPSTGKKQTFNFDQVHGPSTSQHTMFTTTAQPLISRFIEGFNCTILAYGQTSSGKTFTMTGIDLDSDASDTDNGMGIIPRAVSTIFSRAKQLKEERGGAWNYNVKGSFIEIYNEDLIDLLSIEDSVGGRREVLIREDKDGHIIWGGLREVNVRNSGEVMNLIRQGTSIRRTNETEMNAQSSRSHAIFSLTLTQKKYNGSGPPPRSSSPLPAGGRSPSRLARPGSMYTGSSSVAGRPSTPGFASAIGRGGGLRPASAMGIRAGESRDSIDEEVGEWITVVSKFHFVDLAGSERLKRTAAAGERIKEGISINSGLLALGNVISALGDPARVKSHTASHVPYRDSKLTRLLQDSLGGNAHTLMIACVSPAEWNVGETVNTLKYANRARNIKNRAVVNEKEDGWDDVEWLQGTVSRLRKELKLIKETGGIIGGISREPEVLEGAGKKVLAQMTTLQNNYEDLREKFVERTEELTRLRRELGVKQRGSMSGAVGGTAKYEEIVGPVIEEYEKTIGAMEAELSLNRAALRHTNEMVEEKEEELAAITERHSATELYVEELRSRVAKLSERESSTEAYVRDLEEKIKHYDESSITSSESMSDLKREVARFRDVESHSGQYIVDIEARLARSDESVLVLQQTIEKLEKESERRRDEAIVLQTRLDNLTRDGESWRTDLELRERKVTELEAKMEEWERKRKDAGEERVRLGSVVGEVAEARRSLEAVNGAVDTNSTNSGTSTPNRADLSLENQLVALQQTHTATLADLSSVTAKYRDALREISDLAAQIQEAKLSSPSSSLPDSPEKGVDLVLPRRRMTGGARVRDGVDPQVNAAGRRLFFRQAASSDSLHSRSLSQSQSLSQELSSARSRKASISSHGTSSSISRSPHRSALSLTMPSASLPSSPHPHERSVHSLENEIMRLQEVLKEREAEISVLEESLKEKHGDRLAVNGDAAPSAKLLSTSLSQFDEVHKPLENGHQSESVSESDESLDRLNELMLSMAQKESYHREVVDDLNTQLSQVRRQLDDLTTLSRDQAVNMSTELEALRGRHNDDFDKLEEVQQRETELMEALDKAETDHALAIEDLRVKHETALHAKAAEVEELLVRMKAEHEVSITEQLSEASATLEKAHKEHRESFDKQQLLHEEDLRRRVQEANDVLEHTREEHTITLEKVQSQHAEILKQKEAEANAVLQRTEEDYYNALTKLRGDHAETLDNHAAEAAAGLQRLREEHTEALRMAEIARQGSLSESESSRNVALQELQDAHSAAITRKEAAFDEELKRLNAEHIRSLTTKEEDHNLALDKVRSGHEGVLARLKEESRVEMERLKSTLKDHQTESAAALVKARGEHNAALKALQEQHTTALNDARLNHAEELIRLKNDHSAGLKESESKFEESRSVLVESHSQELLKLQTAHSCALDDAEDKAEQLRSSLLDSHNHTIAELTSAHERTLQELNASTETEQSAFIQSHTEQTAKLNSQHQEAIAEANALLVAAQEQHLQDLEEARTRAEQQSIQERERLAATVAELEQRHSQERKDLRKDCELLNRELDAHKASALKYTAIHDESLAAHTKALSEKTNEIAVVKKDLLTAHSSRDELKSEVTRLRAELDKTRREQSKLIQEASKRDSLVDELEKHRSVLAGTQENLQRVKDEKDTLQAEKNKQDALVRELQAQLAHMSSPLSPTDSSGAKSDRTLSYTRSSGVKLPPPTPPPNIPPPPPPKSLSQPIGDTNTSTSSHSSGVTSSRDSALDSPPTSVGPSLVNGHAPAFEDRLDERLEEQAKHITEQAAMIKTLNKQLTHCENDLQTHIDLCKSLEANLGDSEKNLRKARMHATELARERDGLSLKIDALRSELQKAQSEVVIVRRSIVEEKQSLESRLDEERRAKERARAQLDTRMDEVQKRKSKFACL